MKATKKTTLLIAIDDVYVQRPGTYNWVPTICRNEDGNWYAGTLDDENAIEVCKVFFFGTSDPSEFVPIIKKYYWKEPDWKLVEALQNESLYLTPSTEMITALRGGKNWMYVDMPLNKVIYLDYFVE